ncbi:MAG: phosphoribosylglycinamide formyltransferase [Candidatus Micrarchaeota archaeon]
MTKVKVAILASGRGSNFKAIMDEIKAGRCDAEVRLLITNKPDAPAIQIAKENTIPIELVQKKDFKTREALDERILELLKKHGVELVVLAGYMLLIKSKKLLSAYRNRIINIHPALLPAFPGDQAQKDAFDYGVKISGLTIHFVDESLDAGPIIYQEAVDISGCESAEEVADKIIKREHKAYAKVVDSFSKGRYEVEGRRVRFTAHR